MNSTEVLPKNHAQITEALRKAAAANKTIHDICLVFAMRERTRFQVNVGPLRLTMAQEGYHMSIKDVEQALIFFASLGIGKLYYDNKKRLKGLAEIRWTLQSIGKAALGESKEVVKSHQQRRYATLPQIDSAPTRPAAEAAPLKHPEMPPARHKVFLTATISGREVRFQTPMLLTSEELVQLIAELNLAANVMPGTEQQGGH